MVLQGWALTLPDIVLLVDALRVAGKTEVDLPSCKLSSSAVTEITTALQQNSKVERLNLADNHSRVVSCHSIGMLCDANSNSIMTMVMRN